MKVHHIGYLVKNIDKALLKFECLGYSKEGKKTYDESRGINILFILNDHERIELIEPAKEESVVSDLIKKYKNTAYHICYVSNDLEKDIEMIKSNGGVQIDSPKPAIAINNKRVVFFAFASLGIIELLEE